MIYKGILTDRNECNPQNGDIYFDVKENMHMVWINGEWSYVSPSFNKKEQIMRDFEENPELYEDILSELRKRKIQKLVK